MALGFPRDGAEDGLLERLVVGARTQQRPQLEAVVLTQAQIDGAVDGEANAIAGLAEVLRERRDEADAQLGAGNLDVAGGAATGHDAGDQFEAPLQTSADVLQIDIVLAGAAPGVAHGHGFDEAQGEVVVDAEFHHVFDFVFVDAGHDHHVDLDG